MYIILIDTFTRFSAATIIYDKGPKTVIQAMLEKWVNYFGFPGSILSGNGKEFDNEEMKQFAHGANMKIKTTAAGSPWSNGVCERHNGVLTEIFLKFRLSSEDSDQDVMDCAVFAKNCLLDVQGFSPYQLVFGRSPRLPGLTNDAPPALEEIAHPQSTLLSNHLAQIMQSRMLFLKADSSQRISKALLHNARSDEGPFEIGDNVISKREENRWRGPARVIGYDGRVILVRHGGCCSSPFTLSAKSRENRFAYYTTYYRVSILGVLF